MIVCALPLKLFYHAHGVFIYFGLIDCHRYIPLCRSKISPGSKIASGSSFPSLSSPNEILKAASSSLLRCKFGTVEAAAKVCYIYKSISYSNFVAILFHFVAEVSIV